MWRLWYLRWLTMFSLGAVEPWRYKTQPSEPSFHDWTFAGYASLRSTSTWENLRHTLSAMLAGNSGMRRVSPSLNFLLSMFCHSTEMRNSCETLSCRHKSHCHLSQRIPSTKAALLFSLPERGIWPLDPHLRQQPLPPEPLSMQNDNLPPTHSLRVLVFIGGTKLIKELKRWHYPSSVEKLLSMFWGYPYSVNNPSSVCRSKFSKIVESLT